MSKVKEVFCSSDKPLGKLSKFIVEAVKSSEMTAYTEDGEPYKTYCWCCVLWRGIAVGAVAGMMLGCLVG